MPYLIENNSQKVLFFKSIKALKSWARRNGYEIRKSPLYDDWYYTIPYVTLPL